MTLNEPLTGNSNRAKKLLLAAWLVLTPVMLFAGFQQIFSTHADYDDEGYVMLSLVSYMEGTPLYDETYSQYGPFLFIAQSAFHKWTGLPVTHDVIRLKTLAVWLVTASIIMWFLFAQTLSWKIAGIGYLGSFFHLERLCLEPGHPQELCVLAIVASLVLAASLLKNQASQRNSVVLAATLGVVIGATLMIKLNIGVFLFVSVTLMLLAVGPKNRIGLMLFWAGATGAVILPCLVASSHLVAGTGWVLPVVCSVSLTAILATILRRPTSAPTPPLASWFAFGSGVGLMVVVSCLVAVAGGTTVEGLVHGIVGQHRGFSQLFFRPAPIPTAAIVVAGLMTLGSTVWYDKQWVTRWLRLAVSGAMVFSLMQYLPETRQPLEHGLVDRGAAGFILAAVAPALWLLLIPYAGLRGKQELEPTSYGRLPLCIIAVLQPMAAYPTPGTQMAIGTLLVAVGGWIALHDFCQQEREWAAPALFLLLTCSLVFRAAYDCHYRNSLTPLALPGAQLLRVPAEKARRLQWLVTTLREESDTFVFGENTCNSLYFWTQQRPPTSLNPTFWPFLLRPEEQRRVIAALDGMSRTAVVHQPFGAPLPDDSALLKYLRERFQPAHRHHATEVWLPKQRKGSTADGVKGGGLTNATRRGTGGLVAHADLLCLLHRTVGDCADEHRTPNDRQRVDQRAGQAIEAPKGKSVAVGGKSAR